ncbi:AgmX/PglI C-terminal domain-containing protein [Archangium violaceum]|uniref:AgmX/PglI C-terminal domain-containing protein n=1 Tax=Archangium violaceum TaxID=83451 RepID=UPI0019512D40|nr:AgmX/PglI C-terminal domain-containing protein [Archangium violaceum]QRN92874.1 AgmX/PglI C-terminal domain-containing protein [Archangium violaceum]
MKRSLFAVVVLGAGLAFAQGSSGKQGSSAKSGSSAKATTPDPGAAPAQEKKTTAAPARPPPPDINRMPFTPDTIREVMQYHSRDIQDCYEEILATKGSNVEEGRILTTFTITPDGFVRNAKVAKSGTTLKNTRLHECVVNVISSITFPPTPDKREYPIEYPFNLKALK